MMSAQITALLTKRVVASQNGSIEALVKEPRSKISFIAILG